LPFVFGLFPLWTALGAGAEARRLIGTVTIVGMIFSSAFAIFLVPALFVLVERIANRGSSGKAELAPVPPSAHESEVREVRRDVSASG
jgi:hydrophobic/amphiphilic exporter-1 (mainly G- bacteria), HAE1 family